MIEQLLEKKIVDAFADALGDTDIQIMGAWQPAKDGDIKSLEDGTAGGYLTVRMQPRNYETPTIPTAQIPCAISLVMRAEVDTTGLSYLEVTSKVSSVLQQWQNGIDAATETFDIDGKFSCAGFQLTGGDAGIDKASGVWTWTQNLIVFGVIGPQ